MEQLSDVVLGVVWPDATEHSARGFDAVVHEAGRGDPSHGLPYNGHHSAHQHAHSHDVELVSGNRGKALISSRMWSLCIGMTDCFDWI